MKTLGTLVVVVAALLLLPWCSARLFAQTAYRTVPALPGTPYVPEVGPAKAFLGIEEDDDEDPEEPGITVQVVCGSAAAQAGLKTNDVLLALDDQPVNTWSDISNFLSAKKPGDVIRVTFSHAGKKTTTPTTLSARDQVRCEKPGRGFLGVSAGAETENGVEVSIVEHSGAAKAGLQNGDVLMALNDTKIGDAEDITDFMAETSPNDRVRVTYLRDGKKQRAMVTLGEQKAWDWKEWNGQAITATPAAEAPKSLTVNVREKPACLGVYTETNVETTIQRGAQILNFTDESAAQEARLTVGDVITSINGQRVRGHEELWNEIAKYKPSENITVEYLRGEQPLQVQATLKACRNKNNEVNLLNTDAEGNNEGRQFYLFDFDDQDRELLRERQVITIHKSTEGDAGQLQPAAAIDAERQLTLRNFTAAENATTRGQFTVQFDTGAEPTIVSLFDLAGRQLFREELNAFDGHYQQRFDLSEFAGQTLQVQVLQGEKIFTQKIVVR